jgi:hypothetical protein
MKNTLIHQSLRRFISTANATTKKPDCFYAILGLRPDAPMSEIRKRYFELAKIHHPDVAKSVDSGDKFQQISAAYETLSNPSLRKDYNARMGYEANSSIEENESAAFESEPLFKRYYAMGKRQFTKKANPFEWENFVDIAQFEKLDSELRSKTTANENATITQADSNGIPTAAVVKELASEFTLPLLYLLGIFVLGGVTRAVYLDMLRRKNTQMHEAIDTSKYDRKHLKGVVHKNTTLSLF